MGQKLYKLGVVDEYQIEYKNRSFHERELCRFILPLQLQQKTLCKRNYVFASEQIELRKLKFRVYCVILSNDEIIYAIKTYFLFHGVFQIYDIHFLKAIFFLVKYEIICYGWFYNPFFLYFNLFLYNVILHVGFTCRKAA